MKPTSDVPLMMKELHAQEATTPRSRLHRKCASVLTSRRSAPGGVWGSDTTLLASPVNGSGAGYVPHTTPIPRSGFVLGRNPAGQHIEAEGGQAIHAVRPSRLGPMALVDPGCVKTRYLLSEPGVFVPTRYLCRTITLGNV